ncbi:UNVERIFIED_CONTAM: hypothetical protein FKN15_023307 [Acipenser sinensis]
MSKEEIIGVLKAHSERVIVPPARPIYISRSALWTTAFRQFSRPSFIKKHGMLYVTFACDEHGSQEDAADLGGPRREFFRLLVKAIFQDSGAFQKSPNGFVPRMHVSWVSSGLFHTIGQMMSTILVQGGEPHAFLARCVVDYILTGDVMKVCVNTDYIPDTLLRESLKKVLY